MDQAFITRIVEAALLASHQPLSLSALQALFPDDQPAPAGSVEQALAVLRDASVERGVELVEVASGFRYQVQADVHPWVARLWTERATRYTRATLETLALIAYRQPITRGEIEQVRGVAVSSNIIKALEEREWIRVVGHRDVPGKPALFGTTRTFLDYFGLKRLDELPPLSELKDIGELEPQLNFDGAPIAAQLAGPGAASGTTGDAGPGVEMRADETAGHRNHSSAAVPHTGDTRTDGGADVDAAADTTADAEGAGDRADSVEPTADAGDPVPDHDDAASPDPLNTRDTRDTRDTRNDAAIDDLETAPPHPNDPKQDDAVETTTVHPDEAASTTGRSTSND